MCIVYKFALVAMNLAACFGFERGKLFSELLTHDLFSYHDCRLFEGGRKTLWAEKLGLVPKFAGNAATQWGTGREAIALQRYASYKFYVIICTSSLD